MELKPGDIVQLKSGGPEMTISEILDSVKRLFVNDLFRMNGVKKLLK
jgi:uncharacterized protein YodC (DUF2158 family)